VSRGTLRAVPTLDVPVLDAHVHLWDPRTTPRQTSAPVRALGWSPLAMRSIVPRLFSSRARAFVGRTDYVLAPFMPSDLREGHDRAVADVHGFVHVEAGWHTRDRLRYAEETAWLETICGAELRAIVGHADLADRRLDALLDAHRAASPRFVGVRDKLAFSGDPAVMSWCARGDRMEEASWRRGFARLGERDLTFDAWIYAHQIGQLDALLRDVPGTRVVLDHLATPIGLGGPIGAHGRDARERERIAKTWRDDLARLAGHRQLHAKLSGLLMPVVGWGFHARARPPTAGELADALGPHIEHALRVFGVERCMFASNFPIDKVSATWGAITDALAQLTQRLEPDARRALFHDNALRFYGIAPA
jgi:L-fuconolactonase